MEREARAMARIQNRAGMGSESPGHHFPHLGLAVNRPVELFQIREADDGERFALEGELSFASAGVALKRTAKLFASASDTIFDLARIARADSAGVALLLEWQRRAKEAGIELRFVNIPPQVQAIARVVGVDGILAVDHSDQPRPGYGRVKSRVLSDG